VHSWGLSDRCRRGHAGSRQRTLQVHRGVAQLGQRLHGVAALLPLTLALNWRLAILLIVLSIVFAAAAAFAIDRTQTAQGMVENHQASLAATAGDALSNVVVVQSFVRLGAAASVR
jgi:ABC-type multidrug transport system fused ATPase/permease subunit